MSRWRQGRLAARVLALGLAASLTLAAAPRRDTPTEAALRDHIETLASDDFDGREPGTEGETKTLRYLAREWFDMGLVSGTNVPGKDWFAPVELVERTPLGQRVQFMKGKRRIAVPDGSVFVVTSGLRSLVENAPVVFVGRGLTVPARTELSGRVALMLDSVPGAATPPTDRAGRLLEGGASAVITVLDGEHGIEDVIARRQRAGYALAGEVLGGDLEAFLTPQAAAPLLEKASDLAALARQADAPDFAPRLLPFTATLEATSKETRIQTHNLIGRIPGKNPNAGAVLLLAHWDHFGECASPPAEDLICNGAVDNASGVAVITEVARNIARGRQLDRDVYVLATTGEELGLLGALAFAEDPPLPLDKIVAAFNIDSDALVPAGRPVAIIGRGMTGLDGDIEKVIKRMKRKLAPGDAPNMFVRRQDIWALMQHDVPTVMVSTAYSDMDRVQQFMETTYHRPNDQAEGLELGGAADDVAIHTELVRWFGTVKSYPGRPANPRKSP